MLYKPADLVFLASRGMGFGDSGRSKDEFWEAHSLRFGGFAAILDSWFVVVDYLFRRSEHSLNSPNVVTL